MNGSWSGRCGTSSRRPTAKSSGASGYVRACIVCIVLFFLKESVGRGLTFSTEFNPTQISKQRVEGEGGSLGRAVVVVDGPAAIIALSAGAGGSSEENKPPAPAVDISSHPDVRGVTCFKNRSIHPDSSRFFFHVRRW